MVAGEGRGNNIRDKVIRQEMVAVRLTMGWRFQRPRFLCSDLWKLIIS